MFLPGVAVLYLGEIEAERNWYLSLFWLDELRNALSNYLYLIDYFGQIFDFFLQLLVSLALKVVSLLPVLALLFDQDNLLVVQLLHLLLFGFLPKVHFGWQVLHFLTLPLISTPLIFKFSLEYPFLLITIFVHLLISIYFFDRTDLFKTFGLIYTRGLDHRSLIFANRHLLVRIHSRSSLVVTVGAVMRKLRLIFFAWFVRDCWIKDS